MQTFATPGPISVALAVSAGSFRVVAADRPDTTVEVGPTDPGAGRDVKAASRVTVTYAEGVLRIEAPAAGSALLGSSGAVEVTVELPTGSRVDVTAASAAFQGAGRLGDVAFDGAEGSVTLEEAAGARVTLQAGDVTVGRLTGPAQLTTRKGNLRIAEAVAGELVLRTDHGDITVGVAPGASASLDAGTTYGRVRNELRNGDGAVADVAVHATTAHGDITARSL